MSKTTYSNLLPFTKDSLLSLLFKELIECQRLHIAIPRGQSVVLIIQGIIVDHSHTGGYRIFRE